ncbi:MAG: N-acetyl-alpha-D-glucosaminyl L-malate synthase BshA [Vicingaceae bacterium]
MNIGIVLYPTFGGSGVVATELGKALARRGHQVHFITYKQPVKLDRFEPNVHFHEVRVSDYPLFEYQPYEFVLSSKMVDVAKFEKLDLLHVHYAIPHASSAYMAKQILKSEGINLPVITTLHGTDITLVGKDSSFEPVITFAINQSDAVTAVSESLKRDTYEHFRINKDIEVIPNFICLGDYGTAEQGLKESFSKKGEKILIHVSNFRKVKRVEDVVSIFSQVNKKIPSKLLLVGDGPERHKIEEMCRQNSTCNDIHFIGKMKNTESLLAISDVFLLTSEFESFGLAALESMASSVPVISTNGGGIPEVIEEGKSGFMFDVGDVNGMAAKTLEILKDDTLHQELKKGAYQRARHFDLERVLPLYLDLYNRLTK